VRLTHDADLALRLLMYLALSEDSRRTIEETSKA